MVTEAVALARARATRAAFPKGKITERQARQMFVSMADSQVGYVSGNPNWSIFGKPQTWASDWGGRQVYWCALFGGWCSDYAFGLAAALAGFGRQSSAWGWPPVGGTWTVWVYNWARANGRVVSFNNAQSGDIVLTNWGRTGAVVDHYDIATGGRSVNILPVIGGNTSPGNASAGAGVYRAWRPRNRVVAVVRPDWAALVKVYNANIIEESDELSAKEVQEIKDHIDVLRRERTNAHTKELANQEAILEALADLRNGVNVVSRVAAEARELARSVPARLIAARVPFQEGTSLNRLFGKDFRFGALLGYAGATFVDRDTHTEEIVDALDHDALESEIHASQESLDVAVDVGQEDEQ